MEVGDPKNEPTADIHRYLCRSGEKSKHINNKAIFLVVLVGGVNSCKTARQLPASDFISMMSK